MRVRACAASNTVVAELVQSKTYRGTKNVPVCSHSELPSMFLMLLASMLPAYPKESLLLLLPIIPGSGSTVGQGQSGDVWWWEERDSSPGGEMEMPWACFSFPAGPTTRAAAAVGCRYEQLSQAEDGGEAGWKT